MIKNQNCSSATLVFYAIVIIHPRTAFSAKARCDAGIEFGKHKVSQNTIMLPTLDYNALKSSLCNPCSLVSEKSICHL